MPRRSNFTLDSDGIEAVLLSDEVAEVIDALAEAIAVDVEAALPVDVEEVVADSYTTDRAAASVTIKDPRGRIYQARDGVLTTAAAAAGLEVVER